MNNLYLSWFLTMFLLVSCNSTKSVNNESTSEIPIVTPTDESHILSAIITFHQVNGTIEVKAHDFILKSGKLKERTLGLDEIAQGFKCEFMDGNDQVLHTQYIENPLNQRLESTDDQGKIISTDVNYEERSEIVRVNFTNEMVKLSLTEIQIGKKPRLIKIIPLTTND